MQQIKLLIRKFIDSISDELYLRIVYLNRKKVLLHLRNPQTFSEKMQWIKVHGGLERYTQFIDKYAVRAYVAKQIGNQYLIPLIGVWDTFDEIPFDMLPNQFVLKATHGCGYNYICRNKSKVDYATLKKSFDCWMSENFYRLHREPQYKHCVPRIVCEKYLEDETGQLRDYKFFCSKGVPKIIAVDSDRYIKHRTELLDTSWQRLTTVQDVTFSVFDEPIKRPEKLPEMLAIARKLSKDFPFVRVDLYLADNKIYFGELTFTPAAGLVPVIPKGSGDAELERIVGLDLSAYKGTE